MGKYDNGWSLAGICKDKHAVIRLFEPRSFWGNRATHRHAPLPTNHFNDYPEIIHSENFLKAIDEVVKKADDDLQNSRCNVVTKALQEVANNYNKNSNETRRAFQAFARHIGLTIPVTLTQPNALRKFIEEKLTARLRERASSMALVRSLLNIKLKLQNNTVTVADLEAVKQVISQRFNGKKAVDFMPSDFEPSVKTLLEDALVATRTEDNRSRELMSFIDGLIQHPEKVIHAIAPSQRRLFAMMPSFNRFTRQPLVNLGLSIPALAGVALRARGSH